MTLSTSSMAVYAAPLAALTFGALGCSAYVEVTEPETNGTETVPALHNLHIHRVIIGYETKLNAGLQRSLLFSTETRGILERMGIAEAGSLKEVFHLQGGLDLDPVTGEVVIPPLYSSWDKDMNQPGPAVLLQGIRLYNALGSLPEKTEYFEQCRAAAAHDCSFLYVDVVSDLDGLSATTGTYDRKTGHIAFPDVRIMFTAPSVPAFGGVDVAGTLQLTLTTGCVPSAQVPENTMNDMSYDRTLMPGHPLAPYVGGADCPSGELHGRPLLQPDTTGTLDDSDFPQGLPYSFDLAGVGLFTWEYPALQSANVYVVIKAGLTP